MRRMSDLVRNQNPLILPPNASVKEATRQMRDRQVGAVLVAEPGNRLLRIFTGRDAVSPLLAQGHDAETTTLAEVMTPAPDTMTPHATAIEVLRLMQDARCHHLPICEQGRV